MRNLVIDIGNSSVKYGIFSEDTLEFTGRVAALAALQQRLADIPIENILVSSVATDKTEELKQFRYQGKIIYLNYQTPVPVTNLYKTPETLGVDRLAAVIGANYIYPDNNCLVIDAGTAITYDFIDAQKNYHGGSISLGLQMKFKALHTFTQRLPLIQESITDIALIGGNTIEAMQSGVINGTVAELNGIIAEYGQKYGNLAVVLCGGDASFFDTKLKATIFVLPELVLIGLNRILKYNV